MHGFDTRGVLALDFPFLVGLVWFVLAAAAGAKPLSPPKSAGDDISGCEWWFLLLFVGELCVGRFANGLVWLFRMVGGVLPVFHYLLGLADAMVVMVECRSTVGRKSKSGDICCC